MRLPATAPRSCLYTLEHCRWDRTRTTSALERHALVQIVVNHPLNALRSSNQDGPARGAVVDRGLPQVLDARSSMRGKAAAFSEARRARRMGAQSTGPRECPRIEQLLSTAVICGWHVQRSTLCCCSLARLRFDGCYFPRQSSCGHLGLILGPGAVLGCTHIHLCGHTHTQVYMYVIGTHACMQCAYARDAM